MAVQLDDEVSVARALGRLEGAVKTGFLNMGERLEGFEEVVKPLPAMWAKLDARVATLEEKDRKREDAEGRLAAAKDVERRTFWSRIVTIAAALIAAGAALNGHWPWTRG